MRSSRRPGAADPTWDHHTFDAGGTMRAAESCGPWAVYEQNLRGRAPGTTVAVHTVCTQAEWDAIAAAAGGAHTLVRGGIANEGQAEQLARDSTASLRTGPRKY